MNTGKLIGLLLAAVIIVGGGYFLLQKNSEVPLSEESGLRNNERNTTYEIEGQKITLVKGHSEIEAAPLSASKIITEYFGNVAKGDFNKDNIPDLAFLLTQNTGGSGTFFYIVAALQNENGTYQGTNGILLGDRIAPQTTEFQNGEIIVNYAERKKDEPMTASPSIGVSKYFKVENGILKEIFK